MNRDNWDDPGEVRRGDYLVLHGKNGDIAAVALGNESNGRVLVRTEYGVQRFALIGEAVNRWVGRGWIAGPAANLGSGGRLGVGSSP